MEVLLRFKHWQIFMLTVGISLIAYVVQSLSVLYAIPDAWVITRVVLLIAVASSAVYSCWMYAVGMALTEIKINRSNDTAWFKAGVVFQTAHSVVENMVFPFFNYQSTAANLVLVIIALIFGLYCSHFLSSSLRAAETGSNQEGSSGDFFLFLFYAIGIWWLQPRINKLFDDGRTEYDPDAPLDQQIKL